MENPKGKIYQDLNVPISEETEVYRTAKHRLVPFLYCSCNKISMLTLRAKLEHCQRTYRRQLMLLK